MKPVVTPLFPADQHIMMPCIHSAACNIRVLCLVALGEKHRGRRMVSIVKSLSLSVNHVMLPRRHAVPAVFRIEQLVAL